MKKLYLTILVVLSILVIVLPADALDDFEPTDFIFLPTVGRNSGPTPTPEEVRPTPTAPRLTPTPG